MVGRDNCILWSWISFETGGKAPCGVVPDNKILDVN